jgi:hypothetical protein
MVGYRNVRLLVSSSAGTLEEFKDKAGEMCSMSYEEIKAYNPGSDDDKLLPYYCFLSSYIVVLLECKC